LGIFALLVIYAFSGYVSFVKEIEILLYCFTSLIIIYLIIRLRITYISFLIEKKYVKYAKELIQNLGNDQNFKEEDGPFNNIIELFDDFCEETLDKLKSENHNLSSDWKIILEFYKNIIVEDNKYNIYDTIGTFNFLKTYLHYIPTSIDHASYNYLISQPRKIFEIILEKNYLIKKNDFEFSNRFQNYLYYYQAMYHKGFEMQAKLDKLSRNEKFIANILLDRSTTTPKELANYNLMFDYQNKKIDAEFFENYAKEFIIYYRDLAMECFKNHDDENLVKTLNVLKDLFERYEKTDDKIFQRIKQYKEAVLYGLGAWILSEAKIDDKENNIENIGKFLNLITQKLNKILQIQISDPADLEEYLQSNEEKFIKIYCHIKTNDKYKNLTGIDQFERNKMSSKISYHGGFGWMCGFENYTNNYFIYFLLRIDNLNFSRNISTKIFNIVKLESIPSLFSGIIAELEKLKCKEESNKDPILYLLTTENQSVNFIDRIATLKNKINKITEENSKQYDEKIAQERINLELIKQYKNQVIENYINHSSIKNSKEVFEKILIENKSKVKDKDKACEINYLLEREYFVGENLTLIDSFGEAMQDEKELKIINYILNKIPEKSKQIDLNNFHDIIGQIPNKKDAVIILLSHPYRLTQELKKRTFYKDNFKSLYDEQKKLYPERYNQDQIGFYEFSCDKITYEIPVYNYFSDVSDGVMVLDKSRLGKIIQYDMSDDYKEREFSKKQIEELLKEQNRDQNFVENFTKEFYLDLIEYDEKNEYFKNILYQQPDWIKQKGDIDEQINFLQQHIIFVFKQAFEIEFAKNFFGYLFEIEKDY